MKLQSYKKNLSGLILLSIVLAVFLGALLPTGAEYFKIFGDLFLRCLKLLIAPVIFFSILSGVLNAGDTAGVSRLGGLSLVYYFITTSCAALLGLVLVVLVAPGKGLGLELNEITPSSSPAAKSLGISDILYQIFPDNLVGMFLEGNALAIIFITVLFGLAVLELEGSVKNKIKNFADIGFEVVIKFIDVLFLFAPLGLGALVYSLISKSVLEGMFQSLGQEMLSYFLCVSGGLFVHAFVTLSCFLLYFKVSPIKFFNSMLPALVSAFSTASSSATLPITLDALNDNGVPKKYSSFVASLGSTINMDGTALYEAVATLFIANAYGVELDFAQQCLVFITVTLASIGAAGVPGAGIIMMSMVLGVVNLPVEGISLVMVFDRFLDMFRTAVNVWGDGIGAKVISVFDTRKGVLQ